MATCGHQKGRISLEVQRRIFRGIKDFGLERLPTHATMLREVGILPTLVYFPNLGREKGVFRFRVCLGEEK